MKKNSGKLFHRIEQKKEKQSDFKHAVVATLVLSQPGLSVGMGFLWERPMG